MAKSPISVLQEYCAQKKIISPTYQYMNSDSSFVCKMELLDHTTTGIGRSKRDAKHQAATYMMRLYRCTDLDIDLGDYAEEADTVATAATDNDNVHTIDIIKPLRGLCVKNNHALAQFETMQQGGTLNGPEFTAVCQLSTLRPNATSENEKDARQKCSETNDREQAVSLPNTVTPDGEQRRFQKFETYFKLDKSEKVEPLHAMRICDRHNYFANFPDGMKRKAFAIIENQTDVQFTSSKEKALAVLDALMLKPKVEAAPTIKEPMLMITLDCDFDTLFLATEETIWSEIISYFNIMLR